MGKTKQTMDELYRNTHIQRMNFFTLLIIVVLLEALLRQPVYILDYY